MQYKCIGCPKGCTLSRPKYTGTPTSCVDDIATANWIVAKKIPKERTVHCEGWNLYRRFRSGEVVTLTDETKVKQTFASANEAADFLGLDKANLRRAVRANDLGARRTIGGYQVRSGYPSDNHLIWNLKAVSSYDYDVFKAFCTCLVMPYTQKGMSKKDWYESTFNEELTQEVIDKARIYLKEHLDSAIIIDSQQRGLIV